MSMERSDAPIVYLHREKKGLLPSEVDVLIVGGGPAGSSCALNLPGELSVLLVEKRDLLAEEPAGKKKILGEGKCCGGMLDHSAQEALSELGLSLPADILASPQVYAVRAHDYHSMLTRLYPRNYINIHREAFDRFLFQKAAEKENVTVAVKTLLKSVTERKGFVEAVLSSGNVVRARMIIGADGASSALRRFLKEKGPLSPLGKRGEPKVYVGVQEYFKGEGPQNSYGAFFHRSVTDYYSWTIPKGKYVIVGSAIPQKQRGQTVAIAPRFEILKEKMRTSGYRLEKPVKKEAALILRPRPLGSVFTGRGRIFLCGEAAGLISPSSSEGISFALRSGMALGKAVAAEANGARPGSVRALRDAYDKRLGRLRQAIFWKSLKSPVMYRALPRKLVFLTGALSVKEDRGSSALKR